MTYFGFLLRFIVLPILLMAILFLAREKRLPGKGLSLATGVHILLALTYTTPWDNYLVATGVWYYNPALISGVLLGYVPVEEYTFFVLQTLLVGLWWGLLAPRLAPQSKFQPSARLRGIVSLAIGAGWLVSAGVFLSGWKPGTYLSIILFWALPPILLQLIFGADILWHFRRLLAAVILPIGLYLSWADALAIRASTWEIDPAQSLRVFIGRLPVEEGVFFFITVILVTFGLTLALAPESRQRLEALRRRTSLLLRRDSSEMA